MTLLLLYLFLVIGVSFLCSLLESVILSVTKSHISLMVKQGRRGGILLRSLKKNIDRSLAAILTVNTIANTFGAAGVGAQVLKVYGDEFVAICSAGLTFLILFFSEIIPKTLGATYWRQLAPMCAYLIEMLVVVAYPFVVLFRAVSRVIAKNGEAYPKMTREEMIVVAETGVEEGALAEKEQRIIKNLLRLNAILVQDVMTPRSVVFSLQKDMTVADVLEKKSPIFFSRIPVYDHDLDDVIGMVLRFKIIESSSEDREDLTMDQLLMPIESIEEGKSVAHALDEFIKKRDHLFLVRDHSGTTTGIITLEDVIETLLGVEIVDEFDSVEDMRKYALEQWESRKKSRKYKYIGKDVVNSES
ncbi:MAG: DUF21 domain-containing protein [Deltaproteobacteria bacterium]|nr:DUF21 domain-containing protein [Deltaproteobacteria bacterium]